MKFRVLTEGPPTIERGGERVFVSGHVRGFSAQAIAEASLSRPPDALIEWLRGLDGHFRILAETAWGGFAATDCARTYPVIWSRQGEEVAVATNAAEMDRAVPLSELPWNADGVDAMCLAGFTIGGDTLYEGVELLGPSSYVLVEASGITTGRYDLWDAWNITPAETRDLDAPLENLHSKLIEDLIRDAAGRQILVPLSAGLDSRFIASGLKEAGYENVVCATYGLDGNREAETSREIARRLGYPWHFVPYTNAALHRDFHSRDYAGYMALADSLDAIHFPQEYSALTRLLNNGTIGPETLVVNGQSGDFITGNHVPPALFNPADRPEDRMNAILDALLTKHFRQWERLRTPDRLGRIRSRLRSEIERLGVWPTDRSGDHGVYEFCEFQDRQAKYVINGQRLYDHLGLDWRLPLWDKAYLAFWARAPLDAKRGQSLYKSVLHRTNWGNVWQDVPVNPTRIRPGWIRPLRYAAKAAHLPLGQAAWHRFEKRYFDYWMATTCAFAAWPYRRIAGDRRGHHNALAWHIEAYLNGKGLDWDGTPRAGRAA